ncbi:MAG: ATP synthase epsilon chain [Candidatus Gottesmanbacteria bacterium GW2011_GWB1_43_11]|uniref:ATP synthase epsilon chain n=1 Tax=Candidatus Gottesmanbacteria bacterium GW2011_GWB1_43_11 TaxID=1618446 RepID=A0A0G1ETG0_9BACT|nr:MAG: ATP synthase epsilon chain [Candidatus Gottesmanbacteria bacterium GW2011_GWA2_42_16]KKS55803.1 MAG: ATP synthase epsilon chain [Candidatus Gottesmanbacteria bacterium GW2011_GWA1_42_26]KKS82011.1 MAG: F0F1 ATP synthase subunit epsilon, F-type H+-transporting ATPase subunit epsilon [Candidatus Gottesmanbacteria bacterium GW2011_GWC1_43_10]KKS86371.1 MAG: ATP synthase epsilon chain [Candidatus Gottesmanbacteria bacterium GW2011_GWB1_43_11]OGG07974.1 MAG: ATP synthase F1 subunit epsilon [
MTFPLEIVTPERIAFTDQVEMVVVPTKVGNIGILPRHISLFAQLTEGILKIKKHQEEYYLSIGGGFIEVAKDKTIVLVTRAVKSTELNEQDILKAKQAAEVALKQKPMGAALTTYKTLYRQSLIDLKLLRRRKQRIH